MHPLHRWAINIFLHQHVWDMEMCWTDQDKPSSIFRKLPHADEIDAIAAKRESAQREMERRIVAQMLTCLDDLAEQPSTAAVPDGVPPQNKHVVVIGMLLLLLSAIDKLTSNGYCSYQCHGACGFRV